jgi:hypothetical protein
MSTPFAVTVFYLLTVTNNAGQLAPITNAELPAPFTSPMSWSEGQCLIMRGKMAQPEKYVCQVFRSAPSTSWTYVPPGSVMPSEVSPGRVEPQAKPEERKSEAVPPKPDASADPTSKEIAKPKRVAQQPRHDQQAMVEGRQTMFEGNPLTGFFSW